MDGGTGQEMSSGSGFMWRTNWKVTLVPACLPAEGESWPRTFPAWSGR